MPARVIPDTVASLGGVRITESQTVHQAGHHPSRIVLWMKQDMTNDRRFCTHIECLPVGDDSLPYLIHGDYDMTFTEAVEDYGQRAERLLRLSKGGD